MKVKSRSFSHLSTIVLVRRHLAESDAEKANRYLDVLHSRDTQEVFDTGIQLSKKGNVRERKLGVNILSQLGHSKKAFAQRTIYYFLSLLKNEPSPIVLGAMGCGFYYLIESDDDRFVEEIVYLVNHHSVYVRLGLVHALLGHECSLAIKTLIRLSKD